MLPSSVRETKASGVKRNRSSLPMSSPSSSSISLLLRANLYAQELNNSAASCIEIGHHGRAIKSLTRALELCKRQEHSKGDVVPCYCVQCSLDGCCVASTEDRRSFLSSIRDNNDSNDHDDEGDTRTNWDRTATSLSSISSSGYVSSRPIRASGLGHTMGPALYFIIVYNLGLANHLMAIRNRTNNGNLTERSKCVRFALTWYNLTNELQMKLLRQESGGDLPPDRAMSLRSIRFEMMILNNVGQLHKLNDRKAEHDHCLRKLLSVIMMVVDKQSRASNTGTRVSPMWDIETDGFLRNTVSLILQPEYTADPA